MASYWRANPDQFVNILKGIKNSALKKSIKKIAIDCTIYPTKEEDIKMMEELGLKDIEFHYYY